jgi:hypothetical protein
LSLGGIAAVRQHGVEIDEAVEYAAPDVSVDLLAHALVGDCVVAVAIERRDGPAVDAQLLAVCGRNELVVRSLQTLRRCTAPMSLTP